MPTFDYFLCAVGYIVSCLHAATVSSFKPCNLEDSGCLFHSSHAAPLSHASHHHPYDPLTLDEVRADQGDLVLGFRDLEVRGLGLCKFTSVLVTNKTNIRFDVDCAIVATGKYTAGGKLMSMPIEGSGPFELKTERLNISVQATIIEANKGDDGKRRWNVTEIDYSYKPEERIYIKLENLFDGNKEKAKPILEILDHSWKELFLENGRPIIDKLLKKLKDILNEFFLAVPQEELMS